MAPLKSLRRAAKLLTEEYAKYPWLVSVEQGQVGSLDGLVVYVRTVRAALLVLPSSWEGYGVQVVKMSRSVNEAR